MAQKDGHGSGISPAYLKSGKRGWEEETESLSQNLLLAGAGGRQTCGPSFPVYNRELPAAEDRSAAGPALLLASHLAGSPIQAETQLGVCRRSVTGGGAGHPLGLI